VSTRSARRRRAIDATAGGIRPAARARTVEEVATVATAQRELLLRVHRFRLRKDDLEDCYSQATLELIAHAQRGAAFASRLHIANAIELRFLSRVRDRRRALSGRSPMQAALELAAPLGSPAETEVEVVDEAATVEDLVLLREELREIGRLARQLTSDQRRALASQLSGEACSAFCARTGWSHEKYRKVAQRARARLRRLIEQRHTACPTVARVSEGSLGPDL
jgi:DNA-directed RNA polymerase specialized sigma24 family protein